jgi:4'-phosphopantetheinyl transferase
VTVPATLVLSPQEVHVVRCPIAAVSDPGRLLALLDQNERRRASRFRQTTDQRRFIIAHALTRVVLGSCMNVPPDALRFSVTAHGKPELADCSTDVRFNLSHSGDQALLAVALGRAIGVDVEEEKQMDVMPLADLVFSPRERAALAALPVERRIPAFFRGWTRKESFVKARGEGLSLALSEFDVSLDEAPVRVLLDCRFGHAEAERWTMMPIEAGPRHAAAVTVEGSGWRLTHWDAVELILNITARDSDTRQH